MFPECSLPAEPSVSRRRPRIWRCGQKSWGTEPMTELRFSGYLQTEDSRKHSEETVGKLRRLLTDGATAQADPRRRDFYEVENGRVVYYIHVSPTAGKVYLLATWPKEDSSTAAESPLRSRYTTAGDNS